MIRCLIYLGICLLLCGRAFAEPVTVYAAASLAGALQEITEQSKVPMRVSFGSSSTLAKQIVQGAPADVYVSANVSWMDFLERENMLAAQTRVDLLGNSLVVVAPKGEMFEVIPRSDFAFAQAFRGRLAMGDPSHVPAGMYAKEALIQLGWWAAVKDRLAPASDVRGALTLVGRGECAVGIVYATDVVGNKDVSVVATLPDSLLQKPIVYPMAVVKGKQRPEVVSAVRFFQSDEAVAIFKRHGFRVLGVSKEPD